MFIKTTIQHKILIQKRISPSKLFPSRITIFFSGCLLFIGIFAREILPKPDIDNIDSMHRSTMKITQFIPFWCYAPNFCNWK